MLKTITEQIYAPIGLREENGQKYVEGVATIADAVNQNGRIYPRAIWEREIPLLINSRNARPGLLGHPDGSPHPKDNCLIFEDFDWQGNQLNFKARIIPGTPAGEILLANLSAGVEMGISSRGSGNVKMENRDGQLVKVVQEDFELQSFDVVTNPSAVGAKIKTWESFNNNIETMQKEAPYLLEEVEKGDLEMFNKSVFNQVEVALDKIYEEGTPEVQDETNTEAPLATVPEINLDFKVIPEDKPVEITVSTPSGNPETIATPETASIPEEVTNVKTIEEGIAPLDLTETTRQLTEENSKLKKVLKESAADFQAAISALKSAVIDAVSNDEFYTADNVLDMLQTLSWYSQDAEIADIMAMINGEDDSNGDDSNGDDSEDESVKDTFKAIVENINTLITGYHKEKVRNYVDEKLVGEMFANALRPQLYACKTPTQVDEQYNQAKFTVEATLNIYKNGLSGKGSPQEGLTEDNKTPAQVQDEEIIRLYRSMN